MSRLGKDFRCENHKGGEAQGAHPSPTCSLGPGSLKQGREPLVQHYEGQSPMGRILNQIQGIIQ